MLRGISWEHQLRNKTSTQYICMYVHTQHTVHMYVHTCLLYIQSIMHTYIHANYCIHITHAVYSTCMLCVRTYAHPYYNNTHTCTTGCLGYQACTYVCTYVATDLPRQCSQIQYIHTYVLYLCLHMYICTYAGF